MTRARPTGGGLTGTMRWPEAAAWLFRLGSLTAEQLGSLMLLGARSEPPPGRGPRGARAGAARSSEVARRALVGLGRRGFARRYEAIPPWRDPPQGRPLAAYALTRRGVEAGGFLAGFEETAAKQLRARYNRGFTEWLVTHNLLKNGWLCAAARELALERDDLCAEELVGEHGARISYGGASTVLEADGLLRLGWAANPGWSLAVLLEADTGTQGRAEIERKVSRYLRYLDHLARPDPETDRWPPLPVVLFHCVSEARSAWIAERVRGVLSGPLAEMTESLREQNVDPGELFLLTCRGWVGEQGALGPSCRSALSGGRRSVLSTPYALTATSGTVEP